MSRVSFAVIILSFSAMKSERREGLSYLTGLVIKFPHIRRLAIADDDIEAQLTGSLSLSSLDDMLSKVPAPETFHQELFLLLNDVCQVTDQLDSQWYISQGWTLSLAKREILRFVSRSYSMIQTVEQLKRNVRTIRAHRFNMMSKLDVSSGAGSLETADILLCMRHCEVSSVLHPY